MAKSSSRRVRLHVSPLVLHIELLCHLLILSPPKMLSFILVSIIVFFNIDWLVNLIRPFDSLSKCSQLDLLLIVLLHFLYLRFYWTCRLQRNWSLYAKIILMDVHKKCLSSLVYDRKFRQAVHSNDF